MHGTCLNICICDRLFLDQKRLNGVSLNGGRAPCAHEYYSMMWYTRDFYQAWCSFLLVKKEIADNLAQYEKAAFLVGLLLRRVGLYNPVA